MWSKKKYSLIFIKVMIFVLGKVPPRLNYETMDSKAIDVESELQHTMLKAGFVDYFYALINKTNYKYFDSLKEKDVCK